jgi:hypothetical protein
MTNMIKYYLRGAVSKIYTKIRGFPESFNFDKKALIDYTFTRCHPVPGSFADLGGVWMVDGAYTFYALKQYKAKLAFLVDTDFSDSTIKNSHYKINLNLIQGNFGEKEVFDKIEFVDAIFLFDVLLHQVKPDWNDILEIYSKRTMYFVVYNPQWIGSEKTVRLLDMDREEYFKNVPHNEEHPTYKMLFEKMQEINPQHKRKWKDIHYVWQWGITDCDLLHTMEQLGYKIIYFKNCGTFGNLRNFENHAFVFQNLNSPT